MSECVILSFNSFVFFFPNNYVKTLCPKAGSIKCILGCDANTVLPSCAASIIQSAALGDA